MFGVTNSEKVLFTAEGMLRGETRTSALMCWQSYAMQSRRE
jgi:hypothetical protein